MLSDIIYNGCSDMYCELCMYYSDKGHCSICGDITNGDKSAGCASFVERPFVIGRTAGCCGLSGLPNTDSCERDRSTPAEVDRES